MAATDATESGRRRPAASLATLVATGLGAGYSPVAPGTAGSLVGLAFAWPLFMLPTAAQAAAIAFVFLVGVAAATAVSRRIGAKDPGLVVVDEVVGMWISLFLLPLSPATALAGFLLFRVLDVVKPFPARALEGLPRGWGIMADDVAAGIYANLILRGLLLLWP